MIALCVDPNRVHEFWPLASPLIEKAIAKGRISDFKCIERDVLLGNALLWFAVDGAKVLSAAVTQIQTANGRKTCTIVACGGTEIESWLAGINDIEKYARDEGCEAVLIYGRHGWARVLDGYKPINVVLEKELIDGG